MSKLWKMLSSLALQTCVLAILVAALSIQCEAQSRRLKASEQEVKELKVTLAVVAGEAQYLRETLNQAELSIGDVLRFMRERFPDER